MTAANMGKEKSIFQMDLWTARLQDTLAEHGHVRTGARRKPSHGMSELIGFVCKLRFFCHGQKSARQ